ncbi:sialate O-acetylesterase [Paenibacillus oryzisoli]|nr:sialate O-acetylesterase [Paenibacillus oryzisoli]
MIRKLLRTALLVILSLGILPLAPGLSGSAQAAGTNLALGKSATINQGGTLGSTSASLMTDGDSATMWRSYDVGTPVTLMAQVTLDLGSVQSFNKIVLTEYKQKAVQLTVDVSVDNTQWAQVYTNSFTATGSTNRVTDMQLGNQSARYIRISAPNALYAFGIYELEVYGGNLALGKTVTINQGGTFSTNMAANITDGDAATMWRSYADGSPASLSAQVTLDLGSQQLFNTIVLTEYKQKAVQLIVDISDNQTDWNQVYTHTFTNTGTNNRETTIAVDNLTARYIRITTPNAVYAFGLYELEVYNAASPPSSQNGSMIVHTGLYGGAAQTVTAAKADFHLYLFIGQSNMSGRAPVESQDLPVISRAYLFNGLNQWEEAKPGLVTNRTSLTTTQGFNRYSSVEESTKVNGLNVASSFAKAITLSNPQLTVGIISNARGGTSIAEWQKGAGTGLYEEAVRRTKEAMKTGTLKGIIWHQGESDQSKANSTYMSSLQQLVGDLRTDLGSASVPFVAGQLLPTKSADFNQMITTIPQYISDSYWVSNAGTVSIGDGSHFNASSQRLLGQRYADEILNQ